MSKTLTFLINSGLKIRPLNYFNRDMTAKSGRIEHLGIIDSVDSFEIIVRITSVSACGSCQAKGGCGMAELEDKQLVIPNDGTHTYKKGDRVNVVMNTRTGLKSVLFAYVIPVILLLIGLFTFNGIGLNEGLSAIIALATIAIYYIILFVFRKVLDKKIVMTIESIN